MEKGEWKENMGSELRQPGIINDNVKRTEAIRKIKNRMKNTIEKLEGGHKR